MLTAALRIAGFAGLLVSSMTGAAAAPQRPAVADVLAHAAKYIAEYEQAFAAVVSEERYQQTMLGVIARTGRETRTLRSDVLLILGKETGWVTFRDVYEVDGRAVRDRQDRLVDIILKPTPDAAQQAKRIADEGARFNLGPVIRTINTPTMALQLLRADEQRRSEFRIARTARVGGVETMEVEFKETAQPRLVSTQDDAPITGRFWIQPGSGRVLKSEFVIASAGNEAKVTVTYEPHAKLGMLVPVTMSETYLLSGAYGDGTRFVTRANQIEGHAAYSNFRRFSVDTSTIVR